MHGKYLPLPDSGAYLAEKAARTPCQFGRHQRIKTALKHGVVVAGHTARQLTPEMCNAADLILVMEPAHIDMVADILPSARGKTILLAQWLPKKNIPDPFKQSSEMFEAVFQQIQSAAETWAEKLNGPTPA